MQKTRNWSMIQEDSWGGNNNPLQYFCWIFPWTEEPCGLQSRGSQSVRHNWSDVAHLHTRWMLANVCQISGFGDQVTSIYFSDVALLTWYTWFFLFLVILFVDLFLAVLGLCCCTGFSLLVTIFQILKNYAVEVLHSIYQQIWKTQQWPQDWKRSVFIPIAKKGNAKECSNYLTIALISHASKVMLKILQARLQQYLNRALESRD